MKKLLVICGPTATGKTKIALYFAKVFGGELVSVDSRQVYRGLDVATGKDLGIIGKTPIWGINLVDPKSQFDVQEYIKIVQNNIEDIWRRKKLPILIGGTGFYIKALIDGYSTLDIPKNSKLRKGYSQYGTEKLLEILKRIDPIKASSLNESDRGNPRRLMRAIEVAVWRQNKIENQKKTSIFKNASILMIGLTASKVYLNKLISKRTDQMYREGIIEEIEHLLKNGVTWKDQSMNTIGYIEWKEYFENKKGVKDVILKWKKNQENYAKRQMTWFKKDRRINWFDISLPNYQKEVERIVKKWYKEG